MKTPTASDSNDANILDMYRLVGVLRKHQDYETCNEMLKTLPNPNAPDLGMNVALLMATATLPREQLPYYEELWKKTYLQYVEERGEQEAKETLDSLWN